MAFLHALTGQTRGLLRGCTSLPSFLSCCGLLRSASLFMADVPTAPSLLLSPAKHFHTPRFLRISSASRRADVHTTLQCLGLAEPAAVSQAGTRIERTSHSAGRTDRFPTHARQRLIVLTSRSINISHSPTHPAALSTFKLYSSADTTPRRRTQDKPPSCLKYLHWHTRSAVPSCVALYIP
jgi:hypothetical protein